MLKHRAGPLVRLTLNRPERLNALDHELADALVEALDDIAVDDTVRIVVLTGAGRGFCAGGDLGEIPLSDETSMGAELARTRRQMRTIDLLHGMPQVTIAAINGPCAGAGFGLATATDLRVASSSAVFTTAFLDVGLSSDYGLSAGLTRIAGPAVARQLLLLPRRFNAAEALRLGLVMELHDPRELGDAVAALTTQLEAYSPAALRAMKANLLDAERLTLGEVLDREAARVTRCQYEQVQGSA